MNKIKSNEKKQEKIMGLGLLMFASLIVHVILAVAYKGYETDMQCFSWWSNAVFENGVSKFYSLDALYFICNRRHQEGYGYYRNGDSINPFA